MEISVDQNARRSIGSRDSFKLNVLTWTITTQTMENYGLYLFFTREVSSYLVHEIETSFFFFFGFFAGFTKQRFS